MNNIKTREFKESNYKSVYFNGKTLRISIKHGEPITELKYPEFYDVKITERCNGACPYCYMDSKSEDSDYQNVLTKIDDYFGSMDENQRPFQVAIGGGEPTIAPYFINTLRAFNKLDITPNYTTNGMFIDGKNRDAIILATKQYCGGVAVSCHPHLDNYWKRATKLFSENDIMVNLHLIISNKESVDRFISIYEEFNDIVDYFVLLPLEEAGRAKGETIEWEYLVSKMGDIDDRDVAFGANFHPYLCRGNHHFSVSLYEPEIMSGYLDMKDMKLYRSSFHLVEKTLRPFM